MSDAEGVAVEYQNIGDPERCPREGGGGEKDPQRDLGKEAREAQPEDGQEECSDRRRRGYPEPGQRPEQAADDDR